MLTTLSIIGLCINIIALYIWIIYLSHKIKELRNFIILLERISSPTHRWR